MNETQKAAIAAIEAQQAKLKPDTPQYMVGEQLKEICETEPASAALILQDLSVKEMSLTEAEKKIKAWADRHKTGNSACVTPKVAEGILRKFYGLPEREAAKPAPAKQPAAVIDLLDFL